MPITSDVFAQTNIDIAPEVDKADTYLIHIGRYVTVGVKINAAHTKATLFNSHSDL